ncbi:cupin domain-containing protein [Spirosoma utsteinense]|uniref:Quercetin dioxygenase-like cupin family protein n=1 Tax=Spirosoma utsteinense TaxID=2585773 RepID=A0ABR6W677_9BACT|nr:cupin domain-containing protein [Spirosoma utsteinense]MBC3785505.1 quercetin dioxygenase-like cupin family protein [Spirosoma utsteinense]MBC3791653.1 quercetin dioxygenase-like cupin family protein [Spirosoma utsteinense]
MENHKKPITVAPEGGKSVSVGGSTYRILVSGKDTAGAFATIDMLIPPGGGPGPHAHAAFEESFYVIEGEIEVKSEFGQYVAAKGSFITIPKGGVVHSFKNKTSQTAHLLCTVVPAGLEMLFEEIGQPVATGQFLPPPVLDADTIRKLQDTAEKHGQQVFPPNYLG